MGYRYQLMASITMPKKEELPSWFVDKYQEHVDFTHSFWVSRDERKWWGTFIEDTTRVYTEMKEWSVWQLVIFGNEGWIQGPGTDITHIYIEDGVAKEVKGVFE